MKKTIILAAVVVAAQIGAASAAEPLLLQPMHGYRDEWTAAAAQAAISNRAIAAKRIEALPLEQIRTLAVVPEADATKPEGVNLQAAKAFDQVRKLCEAILIAQAKN